MSKIRTSSSVRRAAGLLAISNIASLFLPLVELPFLSRALGVEHFGQLLFLQAIAMTAAVFVEYGFHFSGARRIGQAKDNTSQRSRIIAEVTLAKLALYIVVSAATVFVLFVTSAHAEPVHVLYVLAMIAAFGFSPMWYFLGRGQLVTPTVLDLILRSAGLIAIISLVRSPQDLGLALAIQASVGLLNTAIPSFIALKQNTVVSARFSSIKASLAEGWTFFVYKSAAGMSSSIATTVLGTTSGNAAVGMFSPSEKIIRAGTSFVSMVSSAFFSSAIARVESGEAAYRTTLIRALVLLFVLLSLGAVGVALLAEPIIHIALGEDFVVGAPLLQLMVFMIPFRATGSVLSLLWLIPHKCERLVSRISLINLVFVLVAGLAITPFVGAVGMGAVIALSEVSIFIVLCVVAGKIDA